MVKSIITEAKIRHLDLANPLRFNSGTSLFNVLLEMKDKKQSCVLICEGERCVGIFTERDYLNKVFGQNIHPSASVDEAGGVRLPRRRTRRCQDGRANALPSHFKVPTMRGKIG